MATIVEIVSPGPPLVTVGVSAMQVITQSAYTALTPKVATTLYIIVPD